MNSKSKLPHLERVNFFKGQRLTAADLNEAQRMLRELRWLHNSALHNWGIVFGLGVFGKRGDTQVTVSAGYALDGEGHDIILADTKNEQVPLLPGEQQGGPQSYLLTISYPDVSMLCPTQMQAGVCMPQGATRLAEEPLVRWLRKEEYRDGLDIVLAEIIVKNCRLADSPDHTVRRSARPAQPYIACGQTKLPDWVPLQTANSSTILGFAAEIDTSSAGFHRTPVYYAHIMGIRQKQDGQLWSKKTIVIDGYTRVTDPTRSSFRLEVTLPSGNVGNNVRLNPQDQLGQGVQDLGWYVEWMGVEEG